MINLIHYKQVILSPKATPAPKHGSVRLKYKKYPEIFLEGLWAPICGHYFWDNNNGATLFCKKLGFDHGVVRLPKGINKILTNDAVRIGTCVETDDNLVNCSGGCNDLAIGGHCLTDNQRSCSSGQEANIEIECFKGKCNVYTSLGLK